jgi:hypothetical protein
MDTKEDTPMGIKISQEEEDQIADALNNNDDDVKEEEQNEKVTDDKTPIIETNENSIEHEDTVMTGK